MEQALRTKWHEAEEHLSALMCLQETLCTSVYPGTSRPTDAYILERQLMEVDSLFARRYTLTVTEDMHERLEEDRKRRCLQTIPETIRAILSEYVSTHPPNEK